MKNEHFRKTLRRKRLFGFFTVLAGLSISFGWSQEQPKEPIAPNVPGPIPKHILKKQELAQPSAPPVSRLGLGIEEVSPQTEGLRVLVVMKGSPAEHAGIKAEDVLERFNDQLLIASKQLEVLVKRSPVGTEAILSLRRNGEVLQIPVTLEAARQSPPPSPQLVSKDFAITRRVVRLTVGSGDTCTTVILTNHGQQAQLIITEQEAVEFDGPVRDESKIPPHLRKSIQQVAKLDNGMWTFHLPIRSPVDGSTTQETSLNFDK